MPLLLRPTLAILPVSLLGPGLWLLGQSTNISNYYAGGVLEPALLYGVLPALTLWLGSLPVALATWLLWRRISAWAIPAFAIAVVPSWGLVLYAAQVILPIPALCFFNCPPGPWEVLPTSFAIAGVLAMLSLPVWIHLGILHLLDGSHNGYFGDQIGAQEQTCGGWREWREWRKRPHDRLEKDLLIAHLVDAGGPDPDGDVEAQFMVWYQVREGVVPGETHYKAILDAARVRKRVFEKGRMAGPAEGAAKLGWDQQETAPGLHRFMVHVSQAED